MKPNKKSSNPAPRLVPESPLRFELAWASVLERAWIVSQLAGLHRQSMNLSLMPSARLFRLKDIGSAKAQPKIIGWAGIDLSFNPEYPEFFSLYLMQEYRGFGLGSVIEWARAAYALQNGVSSVYLRMTQNKESITLHRRSKAPEFELQRKEELSSAYVSMCQKCNLFGKECKEQLYFKLDLKRFVAKYERLLGDFSESQLPRQFELEQPDTHDSSSSADPLLALKWK